MRSLCKCGSVHRSKVGVMFSVHLLCDRYWAKTQGPLSLPLFAMGRRTLIECSTAPSVLPAWKKRNPVP
jgi:hypothetical protein